MHLKVQKIVKTLVIFLLPLDLALDFNVVIFITDFLNQTLVNNIKCIGSYKSPV